MPADINPNLAQTRFQPTHDVCFGYIIIHSNPYFPSGTFTKDGPT